MSSRGRGFSSRGNSYRGRGGNDWNNGSNSSGRGGYSSSRGGRFNKYSTPTYDSRNKYSSESGRYSGRGGGRGDHSNSYKRPRDSYSSRDDHRSSSDSSRKRMRNDSYQGSGSGSQRYYGGSSAAGYDDNKRSSSTVYEDKRQNDRSSYHRQDERHSAPRTYGSQTSGRTNNLASGPRYTSSRGRANNQATHYRGRSSRGGVRGFQRLGSRSDPLSSRKRTINTLDYRRKLIGSRSRDYVQRVRMTTKMRRSSGTVRLSGSKKESASSAASMKDKMAKAINAEFSDDDDDDENKSNWDDDDKPLDRDEDDDENQEEKKSKDEKRKKDQEELEKGNTDEEVDKDDMEKEDEEEQKDELGDEEDRDKEDNKSSDPNRSGSEDLPSRRDGKRYIKLNCPHCVYRSVTFKEYSLHLYSGKHNAAMRRVAARRKAELARMRVVQRQEQKRIEAKDESRGTLPSRTLFCPICKLNYRSLKAMHQLSESHRQMKRFLTPFCRICQIPFRSPMLYETHICSLDHLKRKGMLEERRNIRNGRNDESSGAEEDDKEVNLDNFMTLDSVGDVDEEEETGEKKKKDGADNENGSNETQEKKPKTKQMIKVGAEFIKRIEVHFCDLCKAYLPNNENTERAIALHCSTRSHLRRYVRNNDDKQLRREAERIHLQSSTATTSTISTSAAVNLETTPTNGDQQNLSKNTSLSNNDGMNSSLDKSIDGPNLSTSDNCIKISIKEMVTSEEYDDDFREDNTEQLWDDKDMNDDIKLGESGAKSSDDEDSRYDRFRNSEKKLKEKEKNEENKNNDKEIGSDSNKVNFEKSEK